MAILDTDLGKEITEVECIETIDKMTGDSALANSRL